MSMRITGQSAITEWLLGAGIAVLIVLSVGIGFITGIPDINKYLHMKMK